MSFSRNNLPFGESAKGPWKGMAYPVHSAGALFCWRLTVSGISGPHSSQHQFERVPPRSLASSADS